MNVVSSTHGTVNDLQLARLTAALKYAVFNNISALVIKIGSFIVYELGTHRRVAQGKHTEAMI
jgi:hypothetical protein